MTQGMYVVGPTSNLQIDSDQPYSYYRLIASGTGITTGAISGLDRNKDLILAKPSGGTGRLLAQITGTTIDFFSNGGNPTGTTVSANYYILRPTLTGGVTATNYGIRIYNVDGQLAFDSGSFGTSQDVILQVSNIIAAGQAYGNTGNSLSIVYTGTDYQDVYANFNYSTYTLTTIWLNGFFWSSVTPTTIRFESWLRPLSTYNYFYNSSSIVLAKVAIA